jgi:hypothetical protein
VTKYEEMCDVAATVSTNWIEHRNRCMQRMASLITGMRSYCGIPNERINYLSWNEEMRLFTGPEEGNYAMPSAMTFDDVGDCRIGVSIMLMPSTVTFGLFVSENDGKVYVRLGPDKAVLIDLSNPSQCNEFYDSIVDNVKRTFTEPQKADADPIGFQRSQLSTA